MRWNIISSTRPEPMPMSRMVLCWRYSASTMERRMSSCSALNGLWVSGSALQRRAVSLSVQSSKYACSLRDVQKWFLDGSLRQFYKKVSLRPSASTVVHLAHQVYTCHRLITLENREEPDAD